MKIKKIISCLLMLTSAAVAFAQNNGATLTVGDPAPELNVYRWIKGSSVLQFEKGHVYVVDFGATWCVPCAAAIPHFTALQKRFQDTAVVVGVFVMEQKKDEKDTSYVSKVIKYVADKGVEMEYNIAVDGPEKAVENSWLHAAKREGIPTTFVIDKGGMIAWIGVPDSATINGVVAYVASDQYSITAAIDAEKQKRSEEKPKLNTLLPFYINGNGDGHDFFFRSMLTQYRGKPIADLDSPSVAHPKAAMIQVAGASIRTLYYLAYGDTAATKTLWYRKFNANINSLVPDKKIAFSSSIAKAAIPHSLYNYILTVPADKANAHALQAIMRRYLDVYFGYKVIDKNGSLTIGK